MDFRKNNYCSHGPISTFPNLPQMSTADRPSVARSARSSHQHEAQRSPDGTAKRTATRGRQKRIARSTVAQFQAQIEPAFALFRASFLPNLLQIRLLQSSETRIRTPSMLNFPQFPKFLPIPANSAQFHDRGLVSSDGVACGSDNHLGRSSHAVMPSRRPRRKRAPAALPLCNRELARATGLNRREMISRMMTASGAALLSAAAGADAARAAKGETETAEEAATNPLIQKLLATSKANKAANDAARLEDYYRRNFKEYFEFVEGSVINKKEMTPTEKATVEWLAKNR